MYKGGFYTMRQIYNLNTKWAFSKEATSVPSTMPEKWYWVTLPHTWNEIDGQDGDNDFYRGRAYYAKTISIQDLPEADQYYLEFNGANSSAKVYIDGKEIASHDGGYSTWRVEVTGVLKDKSLLVVEVDNSPHDRVSPQMADFTFYGGLYRDVYLIAVHASHFDLDYYGGPGIQVTPQIQGKDARIDIEAFLSNVKENQTLRYTITDKEGNIVANEHVILTHNDVIAQKNTITLTITNVHLWNGKKDPYLYTLEAVLMDGTNLLDHVGTRFGCRTFLIHPDKGFLLNGVEYPLRGVSRHQDRWGVGNALLQKHHEEDMDLICELGATTVRLAHYQHDPYFYNLCDEKGLVVWAEIPYISKHMPTGRENTISQMKELIVQNYNHPSIVVWGISNEITMQGSSDDLIENHILLNDLVHEMDKTRPTTMAIVSMCPMDHPYIKIPDTVAWNHYFGWYGGDTSMNGPWFDEFHAKYPNLPVGCSEYGCEALNWHTSAPKQGDYTEEYQTYYHEELIKQLFTRKYLWATYVWNMFDFGADARNEGGENGQNHKGLVTFNRKYKKDSFYAYKAWLSDEPFVHICSKRYIERVEDITKVTVYSNLPEVELFANNISLGKKKAEDHFFYFNVPNKGDTTLVAVAGKCKDKSFIVKVDTINDAYRLKEKGAILNWFDVTEVEGYFSINDRLDEIMKVSEAMNIFNQFMTTVLGPNMPAAATGTMSDPGMMKMLGGFTILRLTGMLGMMTSMDTDTKNAPLITKEQLLSINDKLNQIPKP